MLSHSARFFATPWTVASRAPLSTGFSRQEHWSGLPFPPPGDLPTQRLSLRVLRLLHGQVGSSPLVPRGRPCPVLVYKQVLFGSSSSREGLINSNKIYSSLVSEIRSTEVSNENGLS